MVKKNPSSLLGVEETSYEELPLSDSLLWFRSRIGKFVRGGIYLIAGQPGIGKSTLGIQLALDLGRSGHQTLYILTEQSKEDLKHRSTMMSSEWKQAEAESALNNILPEESIYDIESLPSFLAHQVLNSSGKYSGTRLIVLDSVQGHGLASTATKKYKQVYEFCRQCKSNGITVILVAHVTKRGEISGPKDMEHNVDCVIVMRKAMAYRPMFVPKNRFGPSILKSIPLEMDKTTTALKLAPHSDSVSTIARSFLGKDFDLPEVQAAITLPSYGSRGRITAPGLPRKEIEQLATCISQIPNMDISDLDYSIHCRLPGETLYRKNLGLPLAMALIASYIQKDIPSHFIYIGEIDLLRQIRIEERFKDDLLQGLWEAIETGAIKKPVRIFLPPKSAESLKGCVDGASVIPCERLDDAVQNTWPELKEDLK